MSLYVSNNHFWYHFLVTKKERHASKFSNISFASFDNDQSNLLLGKQGSILLSSIPSADLSLSIATRKSSQKLSILTTRFHKPMVSSFLGMHFWLIKPYFSLYSFCITPQAIFIPAFPDGCVRKSSGASCMITVRPTISSIEKRLDKTFI